MKFTCLFLILLLPAISNAQIDYLPFVDTLKLNENLLYRDSLKIISSNEICKGRILSKKLKIQTRKSYYSNGQLASELTIKYYSQKKANRKNYSNEFTLSTFYSSGKPWINNSGFNYSIIKVETTPAPIYEYLKRWNEKGELIQYINNNLFRLK